MFSYLIMVYTICLLSLVPKGQYNKCHLLLIVYTTSCVCHLLLMVSTIGGVYPYFLRCVHQFLMLYIISCVLLDPDGLYDNLCVLFVANGSTTSCVCRPFIPDALYTKLCLSLLFIFVSCVMHNVHVTCSYWVSCVCHLFSLHTARHRLKRGRLGGSAQNSQENVQKYLCRGKTEQDY